MIINKNSFLIVGSGEAPIQSYPGNVSTTLDLGNFYTLMTNDVPQTYEYYSFNFTGTPEAGDVGTYNLTLTAYDAESNALSPTYSIQIVVQLPLCIATDSEILLANGQTKLIQDIKRGDVIAANPSRKNSHVVAKVHTTDLFCASSLEVCEFLPNSLDKNIPSKKLITTSGHPVVHYPTHTRRSAHFFTKAYPGIKLHTDTNVQDIMPVLNNKYQLWDLQFETVGTYVANGVVVQSRNPRSNLTPLSKDLYFDKSLYTDEVIDDFDPANEFPLVLEAI